MKGSWVKAGFGGQAHLVVTSGGDFLTAACKILLRKGTTVDVRTAPTRVDGRDIDLPMTLEACRECKRVAMAKG